MQPNPQKVLVSPLEEMYITCPKTDSPCRHCSDEKEIVVSRTGDSVKGIQRTIKVTPLGAFCNNDGRRFVKDISICPATIKPSVPFKAWNDFNELEWMNRVSTR